MAADAAGEIESTPAGGMGDPSSVSFADTFPPGGRLWGLSFNTADPARERLWGMAVGEKNAYRGWGKRPREPPRR